MKKWLKIVLLILAVIIVVAFVGLALITRKEGYKMVVLPREERDPIEESPEDYGVSVYEEVSVTTQDGLNLVGWYFPSKNGAAIIAQHGFESDRQHVLLEAAFLHKHGYGVLLTSFRAHDLSDGELFTWGEQEMQDFAAWYRYLVNRDDVDADKIGIYGESIGGALSVKYASQNPEIKVIVVHSAFSSIRDAVEIGVQYYAGLPSFPFAPMIVWWAEQKGGFDADEINTMEWIKIVCGRPVFILQGGADDHIPAESGQWIYDAACQPKEFWFEPDAVHTGLDEPDVVPPDVYEARVVGFFDQYLLGE